MITERPYDAALACLSQLAASAQELQRSVNRLSYQVSGMGGRQRDGRAYQQALPLDRRMEMVEDISSAVRTLAREGQRFRRTQARALYAEGLTMAQLAVVFGVSRQRVSVLLRDGAEVTPQRSEDLDEAAPEMRRLALASRLTKEGR